MGAVFLAEDLRLNQPVALKFLPPALADDPTRLAALHNEVSIARQIRLRGDLATGTVLVVAGLALGVMLFRFPIGWTVAYKGHRIRFYNHPIWGERLYIDNRLADRGRIGFNVTMRGTIESGAGAGERITAVSRCTFLVVQCRIVVESFA